MGLRVRWSRQSRGHLLAIRQRIRDDNCAAAERMRVRIVKIVKLLGTMPGLGHPGRRRGTMEFVVSPYMIVYRTISRSLVVLGIFHSHREEWEDFSDA
jgi:plasmid stabilization system protein ParE